MLTISNNRHKYTNKKWNIEFFSSYYINIVLISLAALSDVIFTLCYFMYKVIFKATEAISVTAEYYFTAPRGKVISTAREICLSEFGTTENIEARIICLS